MTGSALMILNQSPLPGLGEKCSPSLPLGVLGADHPALWFCLVAALCCAAGAGAWAWERRRRVELEQRLLEVRRESEELRRLMQESPGATLLTEGGSGRILLANEAAAKLLGHEPGELVGRLHTELYGEDLREGMARTFERLVRCGVSELGEIHPRHRNGSALWLEAHSRPLRFEGRTVVQTTLRDLSTDAEQRRRLLEEEAPYRQLLRSAPVAVLEKDCAAVELWLGRLQERGVTDLLDHFRRNPAELLTLYAGVKVLFSNEVALRAMDLAELASQAAGSVSLELIPPHLLQLFQREVEALWEGRRQMTCTLDYVRSDGRLSHVLMHWTRQPAGAGRPTGSVVQVFTDVSELRLAEERLRVGVERPGLALQAFDAGVWECDFATGESHFSERWKQMLGYEVHEIGDRREEWLKRVHPEDRHKVESAIDAHLRGETERYETEHRVLCKDGSQRWVLSRGRVVTSVDGRGSRIVGAQADITARKQAEERLRQSEERLRLLFEMSAEGICESSPDGRLLNVNSTFAAILGYESPEQLMQDRSAVMRGYYVDAGRRAELFDQLEHANEVRDFEAEVRMRGGARRWISENVRVVRDGAGAVLGIHSFVSDVTARRRAAEALVLSEQRLRHIIQHADCLLWQARVTEEAGVFKWQCHVPASGLQRRLSLSERGAGEQGLWSGEQVPALESLMQRARGALVAGAGDYHQVFEVRAGAESLWLSESVEIARVAEREWSLVGVVTDVTQRRQAEESLRTSEARFRQLVEHSPLAILDVDFSELAGWLADLRRQGVEDITAYALSNPDLLRQHQVSTRICGVNDAAVRLLRAKSAEEALERQDILSGEQVWQARRRVIEAFWTGRLEAEGEVCVPAFDGSSLRVMFYWWVPVIEGVPDLRRTQLVFVDLTEIKRTEGALAAEQQRSSRLESLGLLAGGIAHDFNNLLTVVMGNLTLAMMDTQAMTTAGRWLKESERGILRARELTQQLLSFSRGGTPVKLAVSLPEVVRETTEFALHGSKVRAVFETDPQLLPADADKAQIGQVVQNIVINAVQAMPQGGELRLSLRNHAVSSGQVPGLKAGTYVRLTISDTGQGISAENLERIFEPYFTTKPSGSGLGLATVYSIIRKHDGHIRVDSVLGKGTTFQIWLPAAAIKPRLERSEPKGAKARGGRILFMDDEEPLRRLGQALLQSMGHEVRVAGTCEETVLEFERALKTGRPFDLVMLDLTVPGGLGAVAILERLRAIEPSVKAVVMSGYSSDIVLREPQTHGFLGVLTKPYRVVELGRILAQALPGAPEVQAGGSRSGLPPF